MTIQACANAQESGRRTVLPTGFLLLGALLLPGVVWGDCHVQAHLHLQGLSFLHVQATPAAMIGVVVLSYLLAVVWEMVAVVVLVVQAILGTRPKRLDLVIGALAFVLLAAVPLVGDLTG